MYRFIKFKLSTARLSLKKCLYTLIKRNNLLFIHIPKTAGSSFKSALADYYQLVTDYGNRSKNTSTLVQQFIHQQHRFDLLKNSLKHKRNVCLTGHVHLIKYADNVCVTNIVLFLRKPQEQILSHYNHYVALHGYQGDFEQFLKEKKAKNFQSSMVGDFPIGLIGCVGITENYQESLAIINNQYKLPLVVVKANVNKNKVINNDVLDAALAKRLQENNPLDNSLYEHACWLHKQRYQLLQKKCPWTYSHIEVVNHSIRGCAYRANSSELLQLVIVQNKVEVATVNADQFYDQHIKFNFPRYRYIGFSFKLSTACALNEHFDVYAKDTRQKLNFQPLLKC